MSQFASLVDLLANDPEIQALIDQLQGGSFPQPSAGGVFSSRIDPALLESKPGALGGPTASTIAEKTDLLSRGIGTDRFGVEFARNLDTNPANLGPRPSAPRPLGETPSPIDPKFMLAARKQFLDEQREQQTQQAQSREEAKFANQQQVAENQANMRSGLDDIIEQLGQAFGSRDRIPPIGSSFIGAEELEGAIPGSTSVYGVTAGPFTLGRFTSQEAADQARDVLRRELKQGPAPPPSFVAASGVLSPFGRTGAQQFDDQRALSQEQRLAFNALQDAGFGIQAPGGRRGGGGGGRRVGGGGAAGGGQPFAMVQRSMKLPAVGGVPAGFVMVESAQNLRLPDIAGRDGVTPGGQRAIEILSGRSGITSMSQAKRLAGDTTDIRELLDRGALSPDEAIVAEIMRARLEASTDPAGSKGRGQRVRSILQGLGDAVMTAQEASTASKALGVAPGESELVGIADSQQAAQFEASQRARRGRQGDTRFTERETPTQRIQRQNEIRQLAREQRDAERDAARDVQIAIFKNRAQDAGQGRQAQVIIQQIGVAIRNVNRIRDAIKKEQGKTPEFTAFDKLNNATEPTGGANPEILQTFEQELLGAQAILEQLQDQLGGLVPDFGEIDVLQGQAGAATQPARR